MGNSPVNRIDPLGLTGQEAILLACGLGCAGVLPRPVTPPVAGTPGFQPSQQELGLGGYEVQLGLQTGTPPTIGQQIVNAIGGFVNGAISGATNLGNLIFNQTPQDILMPGGQPIGQPGTSASIREMPGGTQGAQGLFGQLTQGGTVTNDPRYPGTQVQLPNNGGIIGIRLQSNSGDSAIDVNVPGVNFGKIHFP